MHNKFNNLAYNNIGSVGAKLLTKINIPLLQLLSIRNYLIIDAIA
jgi:hypothetical protein